MAENTIVQSIKFRDASELQMQKELQATFSPQYSEDQRLRKSKMTGTNPESKLEFDHSKVEYQPSQLDQSAEMGGTGSHAAGESLIN
jgi:hypothetical protein